jgi:hypothetical protein
MDSTFERPRGYRGFGETIDIDGITYQVLERRTIADAEADGHKATADMWRKWGYVASITMKRPKGNTVFNSVEFPPRNGRPCYGKPTRLGKWR